MLTRRDAGAREQCRGLGPAVPAATRRRSGAEGSPAVPKAGSPSASWLPGPCQADGSHRGGEAAKAEAGGMPAVTQAKGKRDLELGEDVKSKSALGQEDGVRALMNTRLMPSCIYHQKYNLNLHSWKP